jgi:perosamine synthetase
MREIPQIEPWLDEKEIAELTDVVRSTWLVEGEKTSQFEEEFARLVQCRHAIAVSNATVGLYCCLSALGVGPDHEVIIPDLTFIATANAVIWTGARPVLVDVDEKTFNLDPRKVEASITPRTRVIMPVHLYGQSADVAALRAIADQHELFMVEDAAQGVGVKFQDRHVGSWGDLSCFSFYGNKTITTGQGGMITTDQEELMRRCLILKNHGRTGRGTFRHEHIGYNFCFTDLQAAVGLAQLSKLEQILTRKRRNEKLYREKLAVIEGIQFPERNGRCQTVAWFVNILVDDPEGLSRYLAAVGIGTRRFFLPLHRQPCYKGWWEGEFPGADGAYARGLSLPSAATLREDEITFICEQVGKYITSG